MYGAQPELAAQPYVAYLTLTQELFFGTSVAMATTLPRLQLRCDNSDMNGPYRFTAKSAQNAWRLASLSSAVSSPIVHDDCVFNRASFPGLPYDSQYASKNSPPL